MDFAEQGAGLPGFALNQSIIHSALDDALSSTTVPVPGDSPSSDGGEGQLIGSVLVSETEERKDDESGANTMLSV